MKNAYGMNLFKFEAEGAGGGGTPPVVPPVVPPVTPPAGKFYDSFKSEENKNFAALKGYGDPEAAIESYRNLEKLKGVPAERLLTLPEKLDDPTQMKEIYERLGKPKDGKYTFEQKADVTGKDTFGEWANKSFNDANLTDAQAKALVESYRATTAQMQEGLVAAQKTALETSSNELKASWGNAYDQNMRIAQAAAEGFGAPKAVVDAMQAQIGMKATMEFFKSIGDKMGEGSFKSGESKGGNFGTMDPVTAKAQIAAYKQDSAFTAKLAANDVATRKIWDQLHKDAAPGDMNV